MGCRGTQSLVVLLSVFNFLALVFSAGLLFVSIAVSLGVCKGKYEVGHIFTYNAHVINELLKQTNMLGHHVNVAVGVAICIAVASFGIITSLFGFVLLCCRCKGSLKATKAYTAFVSISTVFHIAIIIAAAVIMTKKVPGSAFNALTSIQNEIRVESIDDTDGLALNNKGVLFQEIQNQFQCCGVDNPLEWMSTVEWFRNKYAYSRMRSTAPIMFPCSPFADVMPILKPCGPQPEPDCTTAGPFTGRGCADAVENNLHRSLHGFICVFSLLCINQVLGLIFAAIYTARMRRSASASFESNVRVASRLSCTSTQMLMPQYPTGDLSSLDEDQLAQMCFEIIAKNQASK